MNRVYLAGLAVMFAASPALAQRNELTLDATVLRGTVGYAHQASGRAWIGLELGFGFPQLDRTLSPKEDPETGEPDFREYLHLGAFVRMKLSERFEIDSGVRASIADLWPCGASDCLPTVFGGAYVQPMIGWRRIKVGARLTAGISADDPPDAQGRLGTGESTTSVVSLSPFIVRGTLPW